MRSAVAAVAVVGCLLAGCSGASEKEQLVDDLKADFDMSPERAECVADQVYERFSDDEIDMLRQAESATDLSEDLLEDVRAALTPCASAGS